jgi:uncharacterized protein (TIGR02145 family)
MGSGQITRGQCAAIRTIMNTREISLLTIAGWMNIRIEPGTVNIYDNQLAGNEIEFTAIIGSKDISYIDGYSPVSYVPEVAPGISYCEIIIGTQIWMCKNWDADYPGSKVYNNDENNRAIYGGLYTYNQIMSPGFCPAGWHVPTYDEWQTLIDFVGGNLVAGGHLKEIGLVHWLAPNIGAVDTYGFTALGGGDYNMWPGINDYQYLGEYGFFWTSTESSPSNAMMVYLDKDTAIATALTAIKNYYFSVRLIKDIIPSLMDIDDNGYTTIVIGNQEWIIENLKVTHYADGTAIANLTADVDWIADAMGAYCFNNNDITNKNIYGALYNWFAVNNAHGLAYLERGGIEETGWRIPTVADIDALIAFLGGSAIAGGKLKEAGTTHWNAPNTGAIDEYGFKHLPGGARNSDGSFLLPGEWGSLWSAIEGTAADAYFYTAHNIATYFDKVLYDKHGGLSIRLVRNV